jgi:hypothetical protein
MAEPKDAPRSGESLRTRKGKASIVFAGAVVAALLTGSVYLQATDQWSVITSAAELKYRAFVEDTVNDNEDLRADVIERAINHYRDTPAKKSLPLRNDAGQVVGRFRINVANVVQPYKDDADTAKRRIYTVDLAGAGELWHETGGRVRFYGSAFVTYEVDFKVEEWAVYCYFECLSVERAKFECEHIDNILGQIFKAAVRNAGTAALDEALRPGFTVIARSDGETWLAAGRVDKRYMPRKGPYEEVDVDEGYETIHNDVTLLHAGFRDYLGPIELFDGAEVRITLEAETQQPRKTFGANVYVLTEEQFHHFEKFYPRNMDKLLKLENIDAVYDVQKVNRELADLGGNIYILIDNTGWGSDKDPEDRAKAGLVRYYVRAKR